LVEYSKALDDEVGGQGGLATEHGVINRVGGRNLRDEGLGGSVRPSGRAVAADSAVILLGG
jgi:hypothetical protein